MSGSFVRLRVLSKCVTQEINKNHKSIPQYLYKHIYTLNTALRQVCAHLDFMKIMAEVFEQDLHAAVVTVSHEHVVLLFSTILS